MAGVYRTHSARDADAEIGIYDFYLSGAPMITTRNRLMRFCGLGLPAIFLAWPVYGIVRTWLLPQVTCKVTVEPRIVTVSQSSAESRGETSWTEATVSLRNISHSDVRVVGAQSSCGCISSIEEYPFVLQPQDKKTLRFRLQFNDDVADGEMLGKVVFFVDEPSPAIEVEFRAKLQRPSDPSGQRSS
jgi:hypothetical protein